MKKISLCMVSIISVSIILSGCGSKVDNNMSNIQQQNSKVKAENGMTGVQSKSNVKIAPEEVIDILANGNKEGYSYEGMKNGLYCINWANPSVGMGAGLLVNPTTGDVFVLPDDKKVNSNIFEMRKKQQNNLQAKEVIIDNKLKVELSTFFSNFAEVHLMPFYEVNLDEKDLLRFGIFHSAKNTSKEVGKWSDPKLNDVQVSASKVTKDQVLGAVKKYFNKEINIDKLQSIKFQDIEYRDGYFVASPGESEYDIFAIVTKLFDDGNGYYTAYVNVYNPYDELVYLSDPNETIDLFRPYLTVDLDKRLTKIVYKIKAKIHKESDERYILVEYLKNN